MYKATNGVGVDGVQTGNANVIYQLPSVTHVLARMVNGFLPVLRALDYQFSPLLRTIIQVTQPRPIALREVPNTNGANNNPQTTTKNNQQNTAQNQNNPQIAQPSNNFNTLFPNLNPINQNAVQNQNSYPPNNNFNALFPSLNQQPTNNFNNPFNLNTNTNSNANSPRLFQQILNSLANSNNNNANYDLNPSGITSSNNIVPQANNKDASKVPQISIDPQLHSFFSMVQKQMIERNRNKETS